MMNTLFNYQKNLDYSLLQTEKGKKEASIFREKSSRRRQTKKQIKKPYKKKRRKASSSSSNSDSSSETNSESDSSSSNCSYKSSKPKRVST
ncbi:MAG: hypothetical protein [Anelloviridae sp.]|nr:MAG: hypothetical protein [Anelloviridae sp.]